MKASGSLVIVTSFKGNDATIAVTPTLISTTSGAKRRFEPTRRQCYFEEEIQLSHFPPQEGYRFAQNSETLILSGKSRFSF